MSAGRPRPLAREVACDAAPAADDGWSPARVAEALRQRRPLPDATFDRIYPAALRRLSRIHWTPLDVARRAAALLAVRPGMDVLDVGAGAGKLCLVGALTTTARWTGLERRTDLCAVARAAAVALGVDARVEIRRADFLAADWSRYDGLYLYNPIGSLVEDLPAVDELDRLEAYRGGVALLQAKLVTVRPGARVVTYHGIGGAMPAPFVLVASCPAGSDALEVWIRADQR